MDDWKLTQEAGRGALAKDVLDNEVFQEAWGAVEQAIIQKWRDCPVRDKEGQHELKLMLKLLDDVRTHIVAAVESGKVADFELQSEQRRKALKVIPGA